MQNKPKVLIIDSLIGNDYTLSLALALIQQGITVEFIVPENKEFNTNVQFKVRRWAPAKNDSYGKISKTYKYVLYLVKVFIYSFLQKDSVIHFQFFRRRGDTLLFYLMALTGSRLIITAHNILPHEKSPVDKYLQFLVYRSARGIIVHSDFIKKKLLSHFKVDESKVHVIPHGNFDIYLPEKRLSKSEARQKLNLSKEDKVLLFFGLIREYKGLDILIDAFKLAKDCDPRLKLMVIGRPVTAQVEEEYSHKIKNIGAEERIIYRFEFIPSEELQDYFEASDIVVLPYKNIDHSGIVHLAYSFSKPIIASPVGDFPETIEHGKSGFVVKENTPKDLSEQIISAFSENGRLAEMGNYAKFLNDSKYSWKEIGIKTAELYRKVLC